MSILLLGDCLELLDTVEDNSVDLIYCDLPYATNTFGKCVNCEWDKPIDLKVLWAKLMKKKKITTPIFMSCNVKLGYDLISTAPKKCPFRYDLIWVKSMGGGFLNSKRMPLRKHELIYVFYEKLPLYDLSSHTHKYKDNKLVEGSKVSGNMKKGEKNIYGDSKGGTVGNIHGTNYDPPLPDSVIKGVNNTYNTEGRKKPIIREKGGKYDPPLPDSVIKEDCYNYKVRVNNGKLKETGNAQFKGANGLPLYEPPLPNSILEIKSIKKGNHSTEKPVDLIKWILKYYSKDGDTILDCTMGSGTTGIACKEMKRNFIGMELNPEIYEIAVNRIEN
jgi:DNA modification methylase